MSLERSYFENVYAEGEDPFRLGSRWYEERKYAMTVAALPRRRYRNGLEPGCSVGILSRLLGERCDHLTSTDVVDTVVERNRAENTSDTVEFVRWSLSDDWADVPGPFDLVVLSEVGYYLDADALRTALDTMMGHLDADATVLLVHWRHHVDDYPLSGDDVHAIAAETKGLEQLGRYTDADVLVDVLVASGSTPDSVARVEGFL